MGKDECIAWVMDISVRYSRASHSCPALLRSIELFPLKTGTNRAALNVATETLWVYLIERQHKLKSSLEIRERDTVFLSGSMRGIFRFILDSSCLPSWEFWLVRDAIKVLKIFYNYFKSRSWRIKGLRSKFCR